MRATSVIANHHQLAVLDFVRHGAGHGVVEATAGSGKTTTLVQVAQLLESDLLMPGQRACFLAFNRTTAAELRERLPASITATTIHALGRQVLLGAIAGQVPAKRSGVPSPVTATGMADETPAHDKYRDVALDLLAADPGAFEHLDPNESALYLARLADMSRLDLIDPADSEAVQGVAARYRLRSPAASETAALHALLPELLARGVTAAQGGVYDFTDMVYVPVRLGLRPPAFSFVCVDEAQDLSRLNLEFVMRLIDVGARALFVGDPHQAIYAFAGADARSLERITDRTRATRLPLSVSFRCPVRHVALARRFSPAMQPVSTATTGTVTIIPEADLARSVRPGDLVMTRTNAPLVALSLAMAERGIPSRVLGDELATETIELAMRLFPTGTIAEGHSIVSAAAAEESRQLERRLLTADELPHEIERSADRHHALGLALTALERHWRPSGEQNAVRQLGRARAGRWLPRLAQPTVDDLAAVLTDLLDAASTDARRPPVILSTIHKAKGREADRVFVHRPENLGFSSAEEDDDLSEGNVLFVALTRAKRELILVESEKGLVAARLATTHATKGLEGRWNDVLRLACVMGRSPPHAAAAPNAALGRLIIRHGTTRRVQEPGGQTGGSRRGGGRR
ncbi:MAG TPA: UvrD-helicase domain-containing protein [Trueperaceae bacterium]|nr:UvrD-helicase domain-containing protein [Trueperaceae bacterium]